MISSMASGISQGAGTIAGMLQLHKLRSSLKQAAKGKGGPLTMADAGLGCGLGLGFGFGVGLFVKPGVMEGVGEKVKTMAGRRCGCGTVGRVLLLGAACRGEICRQCGWSAEERELTLFVEF